MSHAAFVAEYRVPVASPDSPRPELVWSRRGEGRLRSLAGEARRRVHGRRLAYLDSHFPWSRSGFRYAPALALHEARPDTLFFSMYEMTDPFPAPVLPLAQFPRLAPVLGITDVYGVFLDFMAGILGLDRDVPHEPLAIEGLDLSGVLAREGIRSHVGLLPGGGFVETEDGFQRARRLVAAADQVFSWAPAAIEHVAGVIPTLPQGIDTSFHVKTPRDFADRPLRLLFVAAAKPRKGFDVALATLEQLTAEPVHLHVVGPYGRNRIPAGLEDRLTFHGRLEREELRALHARCHVFLSPVRAERPDDPTGDGGITDGFPTGAAEEAVSSGLLLLSSNPAQDHRIWRPGTDYVELPPTVEAFGGAVRHVLADPQHAVAIAESGAALVRDRLDVRRGVQDRLALMGFGAGRTRYEPKPRARPKTRAPRRLNRMRVATAETQTAASAMAEEIPSARRMSALRVAWHRLRGGGRGRRLWINEQVPGWMNRSELELIARTAAAVRPGGVIVEIGSFAGRSSVHWAANSDQTVRIYCIDPFDSVCCDEYSFKHIQGDAANALGRTSGELFGEYTRAWAHRLTALAQTSPPAKWDRRVDVVFVDGDHTTEGVTRDLQFWAQQLRPDGVLLGHDWDEPQVRSAVEVFAADRGLTVSVHPGTNVWQLDVATNVWQLDVA